MEDVHPHERRRRASLVRWYYPLTLGLTLVAVAWCATVWIVRAEGHARWGVIGLDYLVVRQWGERLLGTGSLYLPYQLSGPYEWATLPRPLAEAPLGPIPCTYPPLIAWLAVPAALLPTPWWWAVPLVVLGACLWQWRPAIWSWPLLSLLASWPQTVSAILVGSTTVWVVALVAAALRWGWPGWLIAVKPTFVPLVLLGARDLRGLLLLVCLALPLIPEWPRWIAAVGNADSLPSLPFGELPTVAVPFVAYMSRTKRAWPPNPPP